MTTETIFIGPGNQAQEFHLEELLAEWQAHLLCEVAAQRLASTTLHSYARGMDRFAAWCVQADERHLLPDVIHGWKESLLNEGYKPGSVNTWFAGVKSFFGWATAEKGFSFDPTGGVRCASRRGDDKRHKHRSLTDQQMRHVLAQPDNSDAGKRDLAILTIMAYAALRLVEVQQASVEDLRLDGAGFLRLCLRNQERTVELVIAHADAANAMYAWLAVHPSLEDPAAPLFVSLGNRSRGQRLTTRAIRRIIKDHFQAAGIDDPRQTAHSLRQSAISNAIRQGIALSKVQAMSRHRSLETLLIYVDELDENSDPAETYIDYGSDF